MYGYFTEGSYKGDLPYTDLAAERHRADLKIPGIEYNKEVCPVGCWERIKICSRAGAESIGRPMGIYHTLGTKRLDTLSEGVREDTKNEIAGELCRMFEQTDVFPGRLLVVGLGNRRLTPDAIGCETAATVRPTMHIKEWDRRTFTGLRCAEIAVITPGVCAESGLDAVVTVKGVCDMIRPDAVIAIDALASRSAERLGRSIQISSGGISPGSGLGNPRTAIGPETVAVPVFSIGVPTVIDSRALCGDECLGSTPMFVSPKEINDIVSAAAGIIGDAINRAFGIA